MDEQMDLIMGMKMSKLMDTIMGNEFGKRLNYNEWMMGYRIILITKNEFNI